MLTHRDQYRALTGNPVFDHEADSFENEIRSNRLAEMPEQEIRNVETFHDAQTDIVVIGCGRSLRRDDQIGLVIAEALNQQTPRNMRIIKSESPGPDLLAEWSDARLLIVVDAARSSEQLPAGSMVRIDLRNDDHALRRVSTHNLLAAAGMSSHLLGIADALILGSELKMLPPVVWVYVIGASEFGYGSELSREAMHIVGIAARRIRADIRQWRSSEAFNDA